MSLIDLIKQNRSIRRFQESEPISADQLRHMVEHARLSASARNQQSLKYILVNSPAKNDQIFPLLRWAGFLKEWEGPVAGERPAAYIVVLHDKEIAEKHYCDEGIAMQSMLLAAREMEIGGCIIAAVDKPELRKVLNIQQQYDILNVIALGKPDEKVVLEEMKNGDYEYWRDDNDLHHVPKRPLHEIILKE